MVNNHESVSTLGGERRERTALKGDHVVNDRFWTSALKRNVAAHWSLSLSSSVVVNSIETTTE